ncbi:VIT domain-containing protein [Balamuthia mandrillaris]
MFSKWFGKDKKQKKEKKGKELVDSPPSVKTPKGKDEGRVAHGFVTWGGTQFEPAHLSVQEPGDRHLAELAVDQLDVRVQISGQIVETTVDLTFQNKRSSNLEGDLVLPLPADGVVCGYAMDVNGQLVSAIPVEKEQARVAFEDAVRKGKAAGLVEDTKGSSNSFRVRVYPIPANNTKTVQVTYLSHTVPSSDSSGSALCVLPLIFAETISKMSLRVEVLQDGGDKSSNKPELQDPGSLEGGGMEFSEDELSFVLEHNSTNVELKKPLVIAVPTNKPAPSSPQVVLEKKLILAEDSDDSEERTFFLVNDFPEYETQSESNQKETLCLGLIFDASLSRAQADLDREKKLLDLLFRHVFAEFECKQILVDVFILRNVLEPPTSFSVTKGEPAKEIIAFLEKLPFDGGTNTGAIRAPKARAADEAEECAAYDFFLLFSDGVGNIGKAVPDTLEVPIYAFSTVPNTNQNLLNYVAQQSGGHFFDLNQVSSDEQVLPIIGKQAFSFLSVDYDTKEITEVYPSHPKPLIEDADGRGNFSLSGILKVDEATLTLNYGFGNTVTKSVTVKLSAKDIGPSKSLISRQWAQRKVTALSMFADNHKKEIMELGRTFGFATPGTSLLILQSLAEYQQQHIAPPRSLPELREQYLANARQQTQTEEARRADKLSRVESLWRNRVEWWKSPPITSSEKLSVTRSYDCDDSDCDESEEEAEEDCCFAAEKEKEMEVEREVLRSESCEKEKKCAAPSAAKKKSVAPSAAKNKRKKESASKSDRAPKPASAAISLKAWDPKTPYMTAIKKHSKINDSYKEYLAQREDYGSSPAFFLDCCEYFFQKEDNFLGLRVLSTILELGIDNPQLFRVVGYKLDQKGEVEQAALLFEKVLALRPKEPQSYRDLALVIQKRKEYQRALELLNEVVLGAWRDDFREIELTALVEANRILDFCKHEGITVDCPIAKSLIHRFDLDLRISMAWDTDNTDIDIHVIEPTGEEAYFGHKNTSYGGLVSRDFMDGYGPEEYMIRKAPQGTYKIRAKYFASRSQTITGGTTILLSVFTNYGRPEQEKSQLITIRLQESHNIIDVGEVSFSG